MSPRDRRRRIQIVEDTPPLGDRMDRWGSRVDIRRNVGIALESVGLIASFFFFFWRKGKTQITGGPRESSGGGERWWFEGWRGGMILSKTSVRSWLLRGESSGQLEVDAAPKARARNQRLREEVSGETAVSRRHGCSSGFFFFFFFFCFSYLVPVMIGDGVGCWEDRRLRGEAGGLRQTMRRRVPIAMVGLSRGMSVLLCWHEVVNDREYKHSVLSVERRWLADSGFEGGLKQLS
jgi:hypothetical protein